MSTVFLEQLMDADGKQLVNVKMEALDRWKLWSQIVKALWYLLINAMSSCGNPILIEKCTSTAMSAWKSKKWCPPHWHLQQHHTADNTLKIREWMDVYTREWEKLCHNMIQSGRNIWGMCIRCSPYDSDNGIKT
jgi:hypothetical protein